MFKQLNVTGFIKDRLEMLAKDYEYYFTRREKLDRKIAEIVLQNKAMLALMQLPGVYYHAAFATQAIVEDAHRIPTASKLAAYGGFAMIGDTSGEEEMRAESRGGTRKPLDGEGRRDLKTYFCEAGQTVLNSCAKMKLSKWGWVLVYCTGERRGDSPCKVYLCRFPRTGELHCVSGLGKIER